MFTIQWRTLLATACLCVIPAANRAAAATISKISGDDSNTSSTVDPGIAGGLVYSCIWVDSALPKAGFDNSTGWRFTYAGAANSAFLQEDLKVVSYYPWVVDQPTYTNGGTTWGGILKGEAGGSYLQLSYTPRAGTTDPVNISWVQAVDSSYYGGASDVHLDNPFNRSSPFYYGGKYAAGPTWFVDIPGAPEKEYENNPVASVEFQVFLAQDFGERNGVKHDVVLYGGVWWGYRYSANDLPEPAMPALVGGGLLLIGLLRRRPSLPRWSTAQIRIRQADPGSRVLRGCVPAFQRRPLCEGSRHYPAC